MSTPSPACNSSRSLINTEGFVDRARIRDTFPLKPVRQRDLEIPIPPSGLDRRREGFWFPQNASGAVARFNHREKLRVRLPFRTRTTLASSPGATLARSDPRYPVTMAFLPSAVRADPKNESARPPRSTIRMPSRPKDLSSEPLRLS